jgi:subtilisin family serine protease
MLILSRLFLLILLGLTACGGVEDRQITAVPQTVSQDYVADEILVGQYLQNVRAAGLKAALLSGAEETGRISLEYAPPNLSAAGVQGAVSPSGAIDIIQLKLPVGMNVAQALVLLSSRSDILYAEPNYRVHRALVPNDPFFDQQWGLQNFGQTLAGDKGTISGIAGVDIAAAAAWEVGSGSSRMLVATIDSGIDYAHPDLAANIWHNPGESGLDGLGNDKAGNNIDDDGNGYIDDLYGWNFLADNRLPADDDVDGHGTHVAGIIGAVGDNALGVAGVNWSVQLMALKFLDRFGSGDLFNAVAAYNYAVKNGARIINASYTYPQSCSFTTPSLSERNAIDAARAAGVLVVAAAGNSGCNNDLYPFYPASHSLDNILSVAATDPRDNRATFSNTGANSVDLGAPGVNIYSTVRQALKGLDDQWGYNYMSGTSMAAPFVSGSAALLWSQHPELSYTEIREALLLTVDIIPALQGRVVSNGRLNIGRAMALDFGQPVPQAPTDLTIDQIVAGVVDLSWRDLSDNETAFVVERSAGGAYTIIGQGPADLAGYTDTTAPDAVQIAYRVKAVAGIQSSGYSNIAEQFIPLNSLQGLVGVVDAATGVYLLWTDTSVSEQAYLVERRAGNEASFSAYMTLPANTSSFTDSSVAAGGAYFYRVKALHATLGDSNYSNEVSVRMPSPASSDKRCFIATAAWGSPLTNELDSLRRFRDQVLLQSAWGQEFIAAYYRLSPPLAQEISQHEWLKALVRLALQPLIWLSNSVSPAAAMETRAPEPERLPPAMIIGFVSGTTSERVADILAQEGLEPSANQLLAGKALILVEIPRAGTLEHWQQRLRQYPEVEYVEANNQVGIR